MSDIMDDDLILYNGTYLNKGGAAIAYGTLKVLRELGLKFRYIIDPDPYFPFESMGLTPIYRYSDTFSVNPIPSVNPIYTVKPFARCLINSFSKDVRQFRGLPIWHIGDSPFGDTRSGLSIVGQIVSLSSLKHTLGSKVIVGGVSLSQPITTIGKSTLPKFFRYDVDYTYTRGDYTNENLRVWGVDNKKYSSICDFAFHLDKDESYVLPQRIKNIFTSSLLNDKPKIVLILREFKSGEVSRKYLQTVKQLIRQLEASNYDLYYIPTTYAFLIPENDYRYLTDVLKVSSDRIIFIRDNTPAEIISIMSNFDCVISARLHGAILGTLAHVPTIHLYEGGKSQEVLQMVYDDSIPMINMYDFTMHSEMINIPHMVGNLIQDNKLLSKYFEKSIDEARDISISHIKKTYAEVLGI